MSIGRQQHVIVAEEPAVKRAFYAERVAHAD